MSSTLGKSQSTTPSALTAWLFATESSSSHSRRSPWQATLWLTGVDYFSSLGYAPGMAVLASGYVAPIATLLLIAVTFFAALPVYSMVAKHSPEGEGSIKMIERLTVGWGRLGWIGKVLVLVLIGFAMTDFVITITLSTADATHHILENPLVTDLVPHWPVMITGLLILGLCAIFLAGFREAIAISIFVGVPYIVMSAIIVGAGLYELSQRPEILARWWDQVANLDITMLQSSIQRMSKHGEGLWLGGLASDGPQMLLIVSLVAFPKLALGLSGFETGVSVMSHIQGVDQAARVRNTRRMLASAAVIMCTLLLGANLIATVLIPESAHSEKDRKDYEAALVFDAQAAARARGEGGEVAPIIEAHPGEEGTKELLGAIDVGKSDDIVPTPQEAHSEKTHEAGGRALSYIAHELLGSAFGSLYDLSTVLILWFAGSSAMAGMMSILPRYLPRFGMSPDWLGYSRPLVLVITAVCLIVNFLFQADVEAQGSAYATGVLVLMSAGAFAVLLAEPTLRLVFGSILMVFLYVLLVNVAERPTGIMIAAAFIATVVLSSIWSRWVRASELRIQGVTFVDAESETLWKRLAGSPDLVLIPLRSSTSDARIACEARRIQHHQSAASHYVFLHVELISDTSQFQSPVRISVRQDGADFLIEVRDAVAVANAIAYVALELSVREVVIGLLDNGTPLVNAVMYLVFGTGEIGYAVRAIFMRLREQWLSEQNEMLRKFDSDRDAVEREVLRDLVVLDPAERQARMEQMFKEERARFISEVNLKRLPHLILFE